MSVLLRFAAVVPAIALLLGGAVSPASAATASAPAPSGPTWSVTPANAQGSDGRIAFSYSVDPGVDISDFVAVANKGTTAATFTVYATDAFNDPKTGSFSLLVAAKPPSGLGSWVKLPEKSVTVQPGQEARLPFQIPVPTDATPGDHTAGIIASVYVNPVPGAKAKIRVEERVAARIYLHVSGVASAGVTSSGQSSGFAPSVNPFAPGTSSVNYAVQNTGNLRVDVSQVITLNGPFGITLAQLTGPRILNLLPGQSVQQQQDIAKVAPVGLVWTTVALKTSAPTDTVLPGQLRNATGQAAPALAAPHYRATSSDSLSAAVPVTLLVLLAVLALVVWLIVRYLRMSRERMFDYLEAMSAASKSGSRGDASLDHADPSREKEHVS